ncbi:Lrp/AsnC family transcriptional regulator [Halobacteriaceae archaeon GCM10025711]
MDRRDMEILKTIAELGDPSPKRIEEETDIPKSTVHYRLNKLREEGVIRNDLYDLDLEKVGLTITVISEVMAHYKEAYHEEVGRKLSEIEGVNQVYFTMGDTDFVVIAHLPDREQVESLIEGYEAIEEVERTSSKFVISTIKNEPNPLRDYSLDSLVAMADANEE